MRSVAGGLGGIARLVLAYPGAGRLCPSDGGCPDAFVAGHCCYHHEQVLFLIWLFALWISFPERPRDEGPGNAVGQCGCGDVGSDLLAAVFAVQGYWAWASIREDLRGKYSGARALAEYLKRESLDSRRIACSDAYAAAALSLISTGTFSSTFRTAGAPRSSCGQTSICKIAICGHRRPIASPSTCWWWASSFSLSASYLRADPAFRLPLSSEYRCVGYFPGNLFWKTGAYEREDFVCYVRRTFRPRGTTRALRRPGAAICA